MPSRGAAGSGAHVQGVAVIALSVYLTRPCPALVVNPGPFLPAAPRVPVPPDTEGSANKLALQSWTGDMHSVSSEELCERAA